MSVGAAILWVLAIICWLYFAGIIGMILLAKFLGWLEAKHEQA